QLVLLWLENQPEDLAVGVRGGVLLERELEPIPTVHQEAPSARDDGLLFSLGGVVIEEQDRVRWLGVFARRLLVARRRQCHPRADAPDEGQRVAVRAVSHEDGDQERSMLSRLGRDGPRD